MPRHDEEGRGESRQWRDERDREPYRGQRGREDFDRGSESEYEYRRGHSRQEPWGDQRAEQRGRGGQGRYGSGQSSDYMRSGGGETGAGQGGYGSAGYGERGGNYMTGMGRPGYDEGRVTSGQHQRTDTDRYGGTAGDRFNAEGWYGGPQRYSQSGRSEDYGGQYGSQYGHGDQRGPGRHHQHDRDYMSWRERQLGEYDRQYGEWRNQQARSYDEDYDNWRRERQEKFSKEFASWREKISGKPENNPSPAAEETGTQTVSQTSSTHKSGKTGA